MAVNLKRIIQSNGFKIYFWPILICYLFTILCAYLLAPFEPDSPKEDTFVFLNALLLLACLWFLVFRYRKITGKSVGKRAVVLLIILSALFTVGIACAGIRIYLHLISAHQ
jgi:positive regulator of sigma E activity